MWTRQIRPDLSKPTVRLKLKTHYARPKLKIQPVPYWTFLALGRHLGYSGHSSKGWWYARYRSVGKLYRQRLLGRADDREEADGIVILNYEQARELAWKWFQTRREACDSRHPGARQELDYCPVGPVYTIGHAVEDWLAWKRLSAAATYFYTSLILANHHILPKIGTLAIDEFNGEHFRKFVQEVLEAPLVKGRGPIGRRFSIQRMDGETLRKRKKTANTVISLLRMSLQMAWENGKTDNDRAWRSIRHLRNYDRPRVLYLSRAECRDLLKHCATDLRQLVLGALYTGCRATELIRMKAMDVGRDGYGVYVLPLKNYRPRFVFLPDEGMMFFLGLTKEKRPHDYLFVRSNGKPWGWEYSHDAKAAFRTARLPEEFCFHGLRHTYASQLVQAGAPLSVVAEQLGHANTLTVSKTYGHLSPQIRESEVRQRFTVLSPENARKAARQKKSLTDWRNSLHGSDWRTYATITDLSSRAQYERVGKELITHTGQRSRARVGLPAPRPMYF